MKMEENILNFGENYINKDAFYKKKKPISTDKVENKRIVLSERKKHLSVGYNWWPINLQFQY